ncbi:DDE superfamily endonuclease [Apiospora arundinis]|uniref:DDE superfamily endonuclease n=1 Tax=Apiospora arundinis TaxID=335852 RepID=A0ABR2IYB4_9PEZI
MVGTWKESQMILALQAIQKNPELSLRSISTTYGVPYATLRNRRLGLQPKREISANCRRLTDSEEDTIIRYIIELNARSFPPRLSGVEDMVNRLLSLRDGGRVGMNWASNFVRRQPDLRTRFNRIIDYQRVLCEDPDAYRAWFTLVRNTITKYGIQEEDIYNFDETGFLMGQISSEMVVTTSDRRGRPRARRRRPRHPGRPRRGPVRPAPLRDPPAQDSQPGPARRVAGPAQARHSVPAVPVRGGDPALGCANCHTKVSPEWRRGPSGIRNLCNQCGRRAHRQQQPDPLAERRGVVDVRDEHAGELGQGDAGGPPEP